LRSHIFNYKGVSYSVKSKCPYVVFPAIIDKAERFVMQTEKHTAQLLSDGKARQIVLMISVSRHQFSALLTANSKGI
jgi:hypothetical protein